MVSSGSDIDQNSPSDTEPANLRFLRRLVTLLTATMIFGLLAIFTVLVMRFSQEATVPLPDRVELPNGETAQSFTQGANWYAIVTNRDEILIFERESGKLRQRVQIEVQP